MLNLQIKKIPAETKVAECIKADAGTGASIESGNHKWPPIWTDFILHANIKVKIPKLNK